MNCEADLIMAWLVGLIVIMLLCTTVWFIFIGNDMNAFSDENI